MNVTVHFYSISKDLAGSSEIKLELHQNATLADAVELLYKRKPTLEPLRNSVLFAIGVDYATMDEKLDEGSDISLIPPVQGG